MLTRTINSFVQNPNILHFKKIGNNGLWSVRVGISYRALGRETDDGIVWFWIGSHADYDKLLAEGRK